jgi:hypothetical protein
LLLQSLGSFRLKGGELLSSFCIRLQELFEDLEGIEGEHAFIFNDTQRLGYLLSAIRNEPGLDAAYVYIQSEMNRGSMTFELAVKDLLLRCETHRADEALATGSTSARRKGLAAVQSSTSEHNHIDLNNMTLDQQQGVRALVTTMNKRHRPADSSSAGTGQTNANLGTVCLVKDCAELCAMPICRLHFASMVCGKTPTHTLRDGHGVVTFGKDTNQAVYPDKMPAELLRRIPRSGGKGSGGRGAGGRRDR